MKRHLLSPRVAILAWWWLLVATTGIAQQKVVVKGRLFDDRGQPVAGVRVVLSDDEQADDKRASAISDAAGGFQMEGARLYGTELVVWSKGWARMSVDIPEHGDVGDLTLARGQHLTGRVRDIDGNAIVGARVLAVDGRDSRFNWIETCGDPNSPAFRAHAVSDERGAFFVPDAVRGAASAYVSARGFKTIEVPADATTPVEVTMHVSGNVAPAKAVTPSRCVVRAIDAGTKVELDAFSAGDFWAGDTAPGVAQRCSWSQLRATEGVVSLRYQRPWSVEVRAVGYARQRVTMEPGDVVVALLPEATISGVVVDPDTGLPLSAIEVRVCLGDINEQHRGSLRSEAPIEALTDADGKFTITGLGSGEWSLVATHAQRHRGKPQVVRLDVAQVRVGVKLESPKGASLTVELAGRLADPRCLLRLEPITPNKFDSSLQRHIDGALAIRGDAVTCYGLDAGAFAVQMLVPQPTRFGRWRKVTVDSVRVAGDRETRAKVDLAAGPHQVHGVLRGAGACPPMHRLLVVAERKIETNMTYQSLFLCGPMARPADDGSFLLLLEPGEHTLLVVDIATKVILGRVDRVDVDAQALATDVGELPFRSRSLKIDVRGPADRVAAAEFVEVRAAELWPAWLGKNQDLPSAEINSKVGVQLIAGVPVRPVWIPSCEVQLIVRPLGGEWVTAAASDEPGASVALGVR